MADKEHVCDECDKSFRTKKGLELHRKNKHSDKKEDSKKTETKSNKKQSKDKKSKNSKKSSKKSKKTDKKSKKSNSKKDSKSDKKDSKSDKKSSKKKSSKKDDKSDKKKKSKKDSKSDKKSSKNKKSDSDSKSKASVASKKSKSDSKDDSKKSDDKDEETKEEKDDVNLSKEKNNSFLKTVAVILILVAIVGGLFYFGRELASRDDDIDDLVGEYEDEVLVRVNGEDVTRSELDFFLNMVPPEAAQMMGEEMILDQLITQRLVLQEAREAGVSFTQEQVDQMYADSMMQAGVGEGEFRQLLAQMGLEEEDFKKYLEEQMIMDEFLENEIFNQIDISEEDARELYDENPGQFMSANAKHILICHEENEQCEEDRTREEAEELINSLYDDANIDNFEELAMEHSDDHGSSVQGGDLGEFGRGAMIPEFDQVVFERLSPGEISEPFETQFGFHIVYLVERFGENFEEVKDNVENILRQQQSDEVVDIYLQQLRERAEIEYVEDDVDLDVDENIDVNLEPENTDNAQLSEVEECYSEYNLDGSVLYVYDDGCPFCREMEPVIDELITEGYAIEKVNTQDRQSIDAIMECSPGQISGVPAYVCPTSGESFAGAVSKAELENFVAQCI